MILTDKKNMGDYQTPQDFADEVLEVLKGKGYTPDAVFEPTVGVGAFLKASSEVYPNARLIGVDINDYYLSETQHKLRDSVVELYNESIFDFDYSNHFDKKEEVLVVGNPPWVTNSDTSINETPNLPSKRNIKKLNGFEALSGSSNFDISEYIILDLLNNFRDYNYQISMLCKVSVAYKVIEELYRLEYPASEVDIYTFSAYDVFNVSTDACMLYINKHGDAGEWGHVCNVYDIDAPDAVTKVVGFKDGKFYTQLSDTLVDIDGDCQLEWRQGVKHDASKVVVLKVDGDRLVNGHREVIDVEPDLLYPMLKSSEIHKYGDGYKIKQFELVTQKNVGQDTAYIAEELPKTWAYLTSYEEAFAKRGSIIYRNAPKFAMFGIGDYTFKPYKVAISGFYKSPVFVTVKEDLGKPVVFDDTCYFIGFDTYVEAKITELILNSEIVQLFISSVANKDAKRPYTKKVLKRIDLLKALELTDIGWLVQQDESIRLADVEAYRDKLKG